MHESYYVNSMKLVLQPRFFFHEKIIQAFINLIIFGKMYFLLISETEFFHEVKLDRMTNFMDFDPVENCNVNLHLVT